MLLPIMDIRFTHLQHLYGSRLFPPPLKTSNVAFFLTRKLVVMFSIPYKSALVSAILRSIFVVIITLPGTHLIAGENNFVDNPSHATSLHIADATSNLQVERAIKEAEKRLDESISNGKLNNLSNLHLEVKLASSGQLNHSIASLQKNGKQLIIMLNETWVSYGLTDEAITRSIIEQTGIAIDQDLHGKGKHNAAFGKALANELSILFE